MTTTIRGRGILRHRFWGDYSAVLSVVFEDAASAADACRALGSEWKPAHTRHSTENNVAVWVGDSEALARVLPRLHIAVEPWKVKK